VNALKRELLIGKVIPAFIFFSLWMDGWLLPLILVPILYVLLVEKKSLSWLGFSTHRILRSSFFGLLITLFLFAMYYLIFLNYVSYMLEKMVIDIYSVFSDIIHYPIYEEIAYRSFVFIHFAEFNQSALSRKNLLVNSFQSILFVSIHKHHFNLPLILIPIFLLGFLNGLLFLKTRNIFGCLASHSILNGSALLLGYFVT
jgi:membrane protease YdiL (CAAX protease family)